MKKNEEMGPLFRRVPREMVVAWEKKNLTGKSVSSLDEASKRIETLLWRGKVCSIITIVMVLLSVPLLVVVLGSPGQASVTIYLSLLMSVGLILSTRYIEWRSSSEVEELQDSIDLFDNHFKALMVDGYPESGVYDDSLRLKYLLYLARMVLYYQDIKIPSARRDERISTEKLKDMINFCDFEKGHVEEYRAGLQNFGDYFNVPTPRSLYDMARNSLAEHIEILEMVDEITTGMAKLLVPDEK